LFVIFLAENNENENDNSNANANRDHSPNGLVVDVC